jgi:toxin ParE1/3/4
MRLVWAPCARRAREDAIDAVAESDPEAALGYLDEIERQTDMLMQYPDMGHLSRVDGTRELAIRRTPFVIVYRVHPRSGRIELIRFLSGAAEWQALEDIDERSPQQAPDLDAPQ